MSFSSYPFYSRTLLIQSAIAHAYVYNRVTRTYYKMDARKHAYILNKMYVQHYLKNLSSDFLSERIS